MKKQTGFFHWLCIVVAAILLVVSLTLTAASAALFFKGQKTEDLKTASTTELIFHEVLAGEDKELVESLKQIPTFQTAQTRYAESLIDWRYSNGSDWTGLSDEESRQIAHELLLKTLEKEPLAEETDEIDYAETVEENEKALMNPLQNLFPSFQSVMSANLIRHLDSAASLVTGRVFIIFSFVSLVLLAVLFLFCRGFAEHSMPIAVTLILASAFCFVLAVRTDMFGLFARFYPDYSLLQTPSDTKTGFLALWALAYLVLSVPFVILSIRHLSSSEEKVPEAEPVPVFAAPQRSADISADDFYQYDDSPEAEEATAIPVFSSTEAEEVLNQEDLSADSEVIPAAAESIQEPATDEQAVAVEEEAIPVSYEEPEAANDEEAPEEEPSDVEEIIPEDVSAEVSEDSEAVPAEEEIETENIPEVAEDETAGGLQEEPVIEESPETEEEALSEDDMTEEEEALSEDEDLSEDAPAPETVVIEENLPDEDASGQDESHADSEEITYEDADSSSEDIPETASAEIPASEPEQESPASPGAVESPTAEDIPSDEFYMHPGHLYEKAHSLSALEADASYDDGDFMSDLPLL